MATDNTQPQVKIEELICRHFSILKNNARILIITIIIGETTKTVVRPKHSFHEKGIFGDNPIFCDDKKCLCCITYKELFDKQRVRYNECKNYIR